MSTTILTVRDGVIVSWSDRYFKSLENNGRLYHGNGWTVNIKGGKIICHSQRRYADGVKVRHCRFDLADGTVGLAGGHVSKRYAYFRTKEFQDFLDIFSITAVVRSGPNRQFEGYYAPNGNRGLAGFRVFSDGEVIEDDRSTWSEADWQVPKGLEGCTPVRATVQGATWAIVDDMVHYGFRSHNFRILYTKKSVMGLKESLMSHPDVGPNAQQAERRQRLAALSGTEIRTLGDVLTAIGAVAEIPGLIIQPVDWDGIKETMQHLSNQGSGRYVFQFSQIFPSASYSLEYVDADGTHHFVRNLLKLKEENGTPDPPDV